MYTEAIALSENSLQSDPTNQIQLGLAGYAYAKSGRRPDAEQVINKFKEIGRTQYVMSCWVASIYSALGNKDKAFAELEIRVKSPVPMNSTLSALRKLDLAERAGRPTLYAVDPLVDDVRDDPRFADLMRLQIGAKRLIEIESCPLRNTTTATEFLSS